MMSKCVLVIGFCLLLAGTSVATTTIKPTTTLAAELGNNTSAANTFTSTNGNAPAGNVSKESIRKLLPPDAATKVYAHFMPWFGGDGHISVGYDSADAAQVKRQIDDMLSRGIDGAIIDWYGPQKTHHNQAALYVKQEAEGRGGKFQFAIVEDHGALNACIATPGCDVTQKLINDLNYIISTFAGSPAYLKVGGRPLIFSFDLESVTEIDWSRVKTNLVGNPMLIFRNNSGFRRTYTAGSYAWVPLNKDTWGLSYLESFYLTGMSYPSLLTFGGVWKGFNDTAASWGKNRIMDQNCGQVWLSTFEEMNNYLNAPVYAAQIITWNDYEEGTAIESGIDNCVSVTGSVSGMQLSWSIGGQENTVDHYVVFASADGENLMPLAELPAGTQGLGLADFKLAPGNYILYVKAVGKPSLTNKMSAAIPFTMPNVPPIAAVTVSPGSGSAPVTITASSEGSFDRDGAIMSRQIDFGDGTIARSNWATHTYTTPGTYTVTLTVTDDNNASGSATTTVNVKPNVAPVAVIYATPTTGTAPVGVTVSLDGSTDPDGSIVTSSIDFGDGTVATGYSASHTYTVPGVYTIRGTVSDNGGLSASAVTMVNIAAPIPFAVKVSSPVPAAITNAMVRVVATTTSPVPVMAMRIYIDGVSSYHVNAASLDTTLALTPGTHNVVIQAWNQQGQVTKTSVPITVVNAPPTAKLLLSTQSGTAPVTVTASTAGSYDVDGSINSTTIAFGDGYVSSGASASHTYSIPGVYNVVAKVTDNSGGTGTAGATVTVKPAIGVTILAPIAGSTTGSPVRVTAMANGSAAITAMRVYVDSKAAFTTYVASLDTSIVMSTGDHNVVVQAWDKSGAVYKATLSVTVK
jgi:PKD repeat protein